MIPILALSMTSWLTSAPASANDVKNTGSKPLHVYWKATVGCGGVAGGHGFVCEDMKVAPGKTGTYPWGWGQLNKYLVVKCDGKEEVFDEDSKTIYVQCGGPRKKESLYGACPDSTPKVVWPDSEAAGDNRIVFSAGRNYCLHNWHGKAENGNPVNLWACASKYDESQKWRWDADGRIRLEADPRFCLHNWDGKAQSDNRVDLWECDDKYDARQQWEMTWDGQIKLKSASGYCLHNWDGKAKSGSRVGLWKCKHPQQKKACSQKWEYRHKVAGTLSLRANPAFCARSVSITMQHYSTVTKKHSRTARLRSIELGRCYPENPKWHTPWSAAIYTYSGKDPKFNPGTKRQFAEGLLWEMPAPSGEAIFINPEKTRAKGAKRPDNETVRCLERQGGVVPEQEDLLLAVPCNSTSFRQSWTMRSNGRIWQAGTNPKRVCLHNWNGRTENGNQIGLWRCDKKYNASQQWNLVGYD